MRSRHVFLILSVAFSPATGYAVSISPDDSARCLQAAANASERSGVPYDVLVAISLVETGRDGQPWPWTVNFAGDGQWFASAVEAEDAAHAALNSGAQNFDLGCFQLNYRWHGAAFDSLPAMLDPDENAGYAAWFLLQHYQRTGDWAAAAAAYHSSTPENAERYQARFETAYAAVNGGDVPVAAVPGEAVVEEAVIKAVNRFPLLVRGTAASHGSIVPDTAGSGRLIGAP